MLSPHSPVPTPPPPKQRKLSLSAVSSSSSSSVHHVNAHGSSHATQRLRTWRGRSMPPQSSRGGRVRGDFLGPGLSKFFFNFLSLKIKKPKTLSFQYQSTGEARPSRVKKLTERKRLGTLVELELDAASSASPSPLPSPSPSMSPFRPVVARVSCRLPRRAKGNCSTKKYGTLLKHRHQHHHRHKQQHSQRQRQRHHHHQKRRWNTPNNTPVQHQHTHTQPRLYTVLFSMKILKL